MEEPEPIAIGPSPEEIEKAVNFFSQGSEPGTEEICKQDWKTQLAILERLVSSNTQGEQKPGLDSSQIRKIVDALVARIDTFFRSARDVEVAAARSNQKRSRSKAKITLPATAFSLPKQASSRLLSSLIPNEPLDGALVRRLVLSTLSNSGHLDEYHFLLPVLRWTNCILHYALCLVEDLECIYEIFIWSCSSRPKLIPLMCDILYKLTSDQNSLVTRWRVKRLLNLREKYGKMQPLENLLRKFKDLRPDLMTTPMFSFSWVETSRKSSIEIFFDQIWSNRDTLNRSLEQAEHGLSAKLRIWGAPGPTYTLADQSNKRRRMCAIPPVENVAPLQKRRRLDSKEQLLNRCLTVDDLFSNLDRLKLPSQSLSLLGNSRTFALLFLNPKSTQFQERFSLTLYRTLYYEFFSLSCAQGCTKRKLDLLCRINRFQEWLQESIPVVERFLVEFLCVWNGTDYFIEIMRLLSYIRITDFDEFNECILSKIRDHFNHTYDCTTQLMVLTYLNRLCLHWIRIEYPRVKGNMTYSFFTSANNFCENPLDSIASLVRTLQNYSELGLTKLTYFASSVLSQPEKEFYSRIYVKEITGMFMLLSRVLINVNMPIKPELPSSFVYFSLFSSSSCYLSTCLEFLAMSKHELIPLCKRKADEFHRIKDFTAKKVALSQASNLNHLNEISKDVLATLSSAEIYLERGRSLFRKYWDLEDEDIRFHLNIVSHPALFPYMIRFLDNEMKDASGDYSNKDRNVLFIKLSKEDSDFHRKYVDYLKLHLPLLVDSLDTFQWRIKQVNCPSQDDASIESATTSGVSSHIPRKSRIRRFKKNN